MDVTSLCCKEPATSIADLPAGFDPTHYLLLFLKIALQVTVKAQCMSA